MKYLLGVEISRGSELQEVAVNLWQQRENMRWQELLMGTCWLSILFGQRLLTNMHRSIPGLSAHSSIEPLVNLTNYMFGSQKPTDGFQADCACSEPFKYLGGWKVLSLAISKCPEDAVRQHLAS